jgi:GNAT superfamily N-acetyltransferase
VEFTLRALEPTDGPGLDALLTSQALSTAVAITTRYRHDVVASLMAQHPTLYGVVATVPGFDGLVGMATAYIDEVQVEGDMYPSAHLENLKVHHDVRRKGLGQRLAEWRIAEARRRFGGPGVIATGVEATNVGSLATAAKWASQTLGPLKILIAPSTGRRPALGDLRIRPLEDADLDAVVEGSNAFHAGSNLYTRLTPARLRAFLAPMDPGGDVRTYRVAVTPGRSIVAGAVVVQRYLLMTDHIERLPAPLAVLNKVVRMVPRDGEIRTTEVALPWFAPGQLKAGRLLWEAIRHEWHSATNVGSVVDPRSAAAEMCRVGFSFAPRLRLMVPVDSPVPLSESKPLSVWR